MKRSLTTASETIMDIPMNAEVRCSDGLCGSLTCVIVNPITQKVTHVVVKEKQSPHTERLVPEDFILESTPQTIHLRCNANELSAFDEFVGLRFKRALLPVYFPVDVSTELWPYAVADEATLVSKEERVPPGELDIHRGARLVASDGSIGWVDEFLVDPTDGKISHLILREGHLWGQKDVTIPVSKIDHLGADTVYLQLDKDNIEKLPAIPVHRWSL